jgi:hypothetical protein
MECINNDLEILREIQTSMEGNPRVYTWVTETIEELEEMNKELAEIERGFTVDQLEPSEFLTEVEFWNKIYQHAKQTNDAQFIREVEIRMESMELEDYFETGESSLTDETGTYIWTIDSTEN